MGSVSRRPFSTAGNVFARHRAALDRVDELEALARLVRLHLEPDVAVLAAAARLLDELAFDLHRLLDRLAVRDLRRADVGFDAEFALHAVDDDLEVQLAHAGDDRLARFLVGVDAERRVFLRQAIERDAHLFLVGLGLRLDRHVDHRLREDHLLEHDDVLRIAQRVAGRRFLQSDRRGDVAGAHFLDLLALVGVHLQDAADAFLAALDRVVDRVAGIDDARIHAEEDQLADVRVGHDLEREAANGSSSAARRSPVLPFSSSPFTGGMSVGAGM